MLMTHADGQTLGLGLSRSYPATSCLHIRVASSSAAPNNAVYYMIDTQGSVYQAYWCVPGPCTMPSV